MCSSVLCRHYFMNYIARNLPMFAVCLTSMTQLKLELFFMFRFFFFFSGFTFTLALLLFNVLTHGACFMLFFASEWLTSHTTTETAWEEKMMSPILWWLKRKWSFQAKSDRKQCPNLLFVSFHFFLSRLLVNMLHLVSWRICSRSCVNQVNALLRNGTMRKRPRVIISYASLSIYSHFVRKLPVRARQNHIAT